MGRGQLESDILPVVRQCFRATPAGVVRVKALVLPSYVTLCASSCPVQAGTCNYRIDSNTNSMAFFVVSHINVLLQIIIQDHCRFHVWRDGFIFRGKVLCVMMSHTDIRTDALKV